MHCLHSALQSVVEEVCVNQSEQNDSWILLDVVLNQALEELVETKLLFLACELLPPEKIFEEGMAYTSTLLFAAGIVNFHETQQLDSFGGHLRLLHHCYQHLQKLVSHLLVFLKITNAFQKDFMLTTFLKPNQGIAKWNGSEHGIVETQVWRSLNSHVVLQDIDDAEPCDGRLTAVAKVKEPIDKVMPRKESEEEQITKQDNY